MFITKYGVLFRSVVTGASFERRNEGRPRPCVEVQSQTLCYLSATGQAIPLWWSSLCCAVWSQLPEWTGNNNNTHHFNNDITIISGISMLQECGGAYLKLLSLDSTKKKDQDLKNFHDKTPYTIMFGPDKCGNDHKVSSSVADGSFHNNLATTSNCGRQWKPLIAQPTHFYKNIKFKLRKRNPVGYIDS